MCRRAQYEGNGPSTVATVEQLRVELPLPTDVCWKEFEIWRKVIGKIKRHESWRRKEAILGERKEFTSYSSLTHSCSHKLQQFNQFFNQSKHTSLANIQSLFMVLDSCHVCTSGFLFPDIFSSFWKGMENRRVCVFLSLIWFCFLQFPLDLLLMQ